MTRVRPSIVLSSAVVEGSTEASTRPETRSPAVSHGAVTVVLGRFGLENAHPLPLIVMSPKSFAPKRSKSDARYAIVSATSARMSW